MNQGTPLPTGTGYLVVQVTTASSAIPLEDATVTVTRDEENSAEVLSVLRSGRDGRTERIALEAPPRAGSLSYGGKAFSTYNIRVEAEGYEQANYNHVPIFDGITAIQQANLIPRPANGYPDDFSLNRPRIYGTGNEQGV